MAFIDISKERLIELTGYDYTIHRHYYEFDIPKRNGKLRHIKTPVGSLKEAQANIVHHLQMRGATPAPAAHGFVSGRGCVSAVVPHRDNNWFLKLDLNNFFPSIDYTQVRRLIAQYYTDTNEINYLTYLLVDETGHLTQGCKSSPFIANMVLKDFDNHITKYCEKAGIIYTRYADDMLFSAPEWFNWHRMVEVVHNTLPKQLSLSTDKTDYRHGCWSNYHLGIGVTKDHELKIGTERKNHIKHLAYEATQGRLTPKELSHARGLLSYYSNIEPDYFIGNPKFDSLRRA